MRNILETASGGSKSGGSNFISLFSHQISENLPIFTVIEVFCLLPKIERRFKQELRQLRDDEEESDSGEFFSIDLIFERSKLTRDGRCTFAITILEKTILQNALG